MAFLTVTPDTLDSLAQACRDEAGQLEGVMGRVEGKIANMEWESQAASKFKGEWTTHKQNLRNLMDSLTQYGETASKMATRYREADSAYRGA